MAVEKQKVIARLKALFPKANLSQKRLDAIADKLSQKPADDADDTAIDAVINDFNDVMSLEDIAREDDRIRTLEAKAKEPANPNPDDKTKTEPTKVADDAPQWAKDMAATNQKLLEKVEALESGKVIDTKKQTAAQLFDKSEALKGLKPELRQRWIDRVDVNSETSLEDQIKGLEVEYTDLTQGLADNGSYSGFPPQTKGPVNAPSAEAIDSIVGEMGV